MPFPDPTGGGVILPLDHDNPAQVTGVSPDDHHLEVHAIDGVDHTGVLVDGQIPASIARDSELHAEVHAIGGADHTGAITDAQHGARGPIVGAHGHDDLDTVTADQHHAELHSIIGVDHDGFPGGMATFLRADKTFAAPTAAVADPVYSPGSFTIITETGRYIPARMKLAGAQRATIQGTGRLVIT